MSAERLRGLVEKWRSVDYRVEASTDDSLSVLRTCGDELEQAIGEMVDDAAVDRFIAGAMAKDRANCASRESIKAGLLAALGEKP